MVNSTIEPGTLGEVIVGVLAAMLLVRVIAGITEGYKAESQKRILISIAALNGLILEIGLSPMSTVASELVPLSPLVSPQFPTIIQSLIAVGTIFEILYGLDKMHHGSGGFGVLGFISAFLGGTLLPYPNSMIAGAVLFWIAFVLTELSPANQWRARGL